MLMSAALRARRTFPPSGLFVAISRPIHLRPRDPHPRVRLPVLAALFVFTPLVPLQGVHFLPGEYTPVV